MVGVAPNSKDDSSSSKNPMIQYMLKTRENHAMNQDHDYSHAFRKKTRFEMFRLSIIAMAIEFAYAAETSFVSPILLQIGVDHRLMTMAWGISPLVGFFLSPLLGSISDRCTLNWGRRRPIISLLSTGIVLGLILVPFGKDLGMLLGDAGYNYNNTENIFANISNTGGSVAALTADTPSASNFKYAVILTIIGMVLLDFDADTCQTPARTYMLDMCIPQEQPKALTTFTLFAGFGGTIGYAIGGIDWESWQIGEFFGGNIPTVFIIVTVIFIVCFFITITTFREIPLKLIEQDELLKPLSNAAIKKELDKNKDTIYYIKELQELKNGANDDDEEELRTLSLQTTALELRAVNENKDNFDIIESYQNGYTPSIEKRNSYNGDINCNNNATIELDDDVTVEKPITLAQYLKSIIIMPRSMRILAITNLFCWMGHVTYSLYFTDFVGEAVFGGDPSAPPNSEAAQLYNEGIRFGCWGMSIYAFSCSVYSMTVTKLIKWFGSKTVYIAGILYYGIGMLILGLWPTEWGVLFFSTSAGILYGTLFTMPYILVANYHAQNCFHVRNGETVPLKQSRGLGTDVAIISSMVFVAQLVVSLSMGPLITWLNTTAAILYASAFFAVIAAIFASFVLYI